MEDLKEIVESYVNLTIHSKTVAQNQKRETDTFYLKRKPCLLFPSWLEVPEGPNKVRPDRRRLAVGNMRFGSRSGQKPEIKFDGGIRLRQFDTAKARGPPEQIAFGLFDVADVIRRTWCWQAGSNSGTVTQFRCPTPPAPSRSWLASGQAGIFVLPYKAGEGFVMGKRATATVLWNGGVLLGQAKPKRARFH